MASGGFRENAGRPKGSRNVSTLARETQRAAAAAALRERIGNVVGELGPVEIMVAVARELLLAGDLSGAASAAALAAPYTDERKGVAQPEGGDAFTAADIANDTDPETLER